MSVFGVLALSLGCAGDPDDDRPPPTGPTGPTGATGDTAGPGPLPTGDTGQEIEPPAAFGSLPIGELAATTIAGINPSNIAGSPIHAGDLDGDGHDDLVLGQKAFALEQTGRVWVFRGPLAPGALTIDDADLTFAGETVPHNVGFHLAAVPDTTGDGLPDLAMSSLNDATGVNSATVYVTSGVGSGLVPVAGAVGRIHGAEFDLVGQYSLHAGDLDDDGVGDVVTSAQSGDGPVAFVFEGPIAGDLAAREAASATLRSDADPNVIGRVQVAGDLDGDGNTDLAFATPSYGTPGTSSLLLFAGPIAGDVPIEAHTAQVELGQSQIVDAIAALGDTNGDGHDDLVLGCPYAEGPAGYLGGRVWVFAGPIVDGDASTATATIDGVVPEGWFGEFAASADDLDGDGLPDLAVGGDSNGWTVLDAPGEAYVFLAPFAGRMDAGAATTTFTAEWDRQRVGAAVGGVGDLDGDGIGDLVVSAVGDFETDDIDSGGTAYLFSGASWR